MYNDIGDNMQYLKKYGNILLYIIIIVFVIILTILLKGYFNNNDNAETNDYSRIENNLISYAQDYIEYNNIISDREIYINNSKLEYELPSNCKKTSGVLYDGNDYKAYLDCDGYTSSVGTNGNMIDLNGNLLEFVFDGNSYSELGYKNNSDIHISGSVGYDDGVYDVQYSIFSNRDIIDYALRKVVVTSDISLKNLFPTIKLNGDKVEYLNINNMYHENGYTVYDSRDGDLTNKVIVSSNVNPSKPGEYYVNYSVTNSLGYTSSVSRQIIVDDISTNIYVIDNEDITVPTNKSINIKLNIYCENYNYTVLPNGTISFGQEIMYSVNENNIYKFEIHYINDKKDTIYEKSVSIKNIDKTIPTGTCDLHLNPEGSNISVNADDGKRIIGYKYDIDGVKTDFISSNNYYDIKSNDISKASVEIKDSVGNIGTVDCNVIDNRYKYNEKGYTKRFDAEKLQMPIMDALSRKGYSINDLNKCIYDRVKIAGPGTRYGVVEAGVGLIECTYQMTGRVVPYDHEGGKVEEEPGGTIYSKANKDIYGKLGVNSKWGKLGGIGKPSNPEPRYGLNCANFIHWSFCNGGMDMCTKGSAGAGSQASTKYYPEADIFSILGDEVTYKSGRNLSNSAIEILRMIKPGDVVHSISADGKSSTEHVRLVVGITENGFYYADDGQKMGFLSFSNLMNGRFRYRILLLDNYYKNENNKNNLYN